MTGKTAGVMRSQMYPRDQRYLKGAGGRKNKEKIKRGTPNFSFLWVSALLEMYLLYSVTSQVLLNPHEVINKRMPDVQTLYKKYVALKENKKHL